MPGIFISYRRSDTGAYPARVAKSLSQQFSETEVFFDRDSLRAGEDFVDAIDQAVGSCAVLLVFIGPGWSDAADRSGRRRLEDERDFVRLEIAAALKRKILVIPVLVQGAAMPAATSLPEPLVALARLQAHELSDTRWDYDEGKLLDRIEEVPGIGVRRKPGNAALVGRMAAGAGNVARLLVAALARAAAVTVVLAGATYWIGASWHGNVSTWQSISNGLFVLLIAYYGGEVVFAVRRLRNRRDGRDK